MGCVIFDFDGVIVDTEHKKFKDLKRIMKEKGINVNSSLFKLFTGQKRGFFLKKYFPELTEYKINQILIKLRELDNYIESVELVKGIKKLLIFIKSKKIKTGIATGSLRDTVEKTLKKFKIDSFFDFIVSGDEINISKPNPIILKYALKKYNIDNKKTIVIEDSPAGIEAAKRAELFTIGLGTYFNKRELSESDIFFKSHIEVLKFFRKNL